MTRRRGLRAVVALSVLASVCFLAWATAAAQDEPNLILNFDFSLGLNDQGLPLHWTLFGQGPMTSFELSDERATAGTHSLKLIDDNPEGSIGLRSHRVETAPGRRYIAEVDVFGESGSAMLYIDFLDAQGRRVQERAERKSAAMKWETITVEATAPEGAAYVTLILYANIANTGVFYYDNVRLYDITDRPLSLEEQQPAVRQLGYLPEDGSQAAVNPPPLIWLPDRAATGYIVEYGPDPSFAPGSYRRVEGIELPLYVPSHTFEPGTWYWRFWGVAADGQVYGPSRVRSFVIAEGLPEMPLPPTEEWMARIPKAHPRLFLRPEQVPSLRESINPALLSSVFNKGHMASVLGVQLPPEPRSAYESGSLDIDVWRSELNAMLPVFEVLEELAFLYVLTGKEQYAREGKKLLVHLAQMDPRGSTSYSGAPEIAMRMIYFIPRAYSWLYDALDEAERDIVRASARARGEEAYRMLKNLPYETSPYSSHPGRMLGFLGQLSLAFLDEIPEARGWLEYAVNLTAAIWPAWGGEDGGYSEGHGYWRSYLGWMFDFLDAIKVAADLDLYKKPFFQNTGYFALYAHSVGTGQPFSDGHNASAAGNGQVMAHLARVTQNPYFRWYADRVGFDHRARFLALLPQPPLPPSKEPADLPNARWFRDVGWVALHKELANPSENFQFTLKSSPYGSVSHSYADQNAFVLYAAGEGLAVSSGYYPYYNSPHHANWSNQTKSKNSLLIDGRGQTPNDMAARGEVLGLFHSSLYDYTAADAVEAYPLPYLSRFTRHVVYVRPDVYVLIDDVRAAQPVSVDWLLHSRFPIEWSQEAQSASIRGSRAALDVRLLAPGGFSGTVTDGFEPPPEATSYQNEWHLTVSTREKASHVTIVSLLAPRLLRDDSEILDAEAKVDGEAVHVRIARRTADQQVVTEFIEVQLPGEGEASLAAVRAWAVGEGESLLRGFVHHAAGAPLPESASAVRWITPGWAAAAHWNAAERTISLELGRTGAADHRTVFGPGQNVEIGLAAPFEPARITVNGYTVSDWRYDPEAKAVVVNY